MPGTVSVLWDEIFLDHVPPAGEFEAAWTGRLAVEEPHPDRPARIQNIKHVLKHELSQYCTWEDVSPAIRHQVQRVHSPDYVDELESFCRDGGGRLTAETGANERTYEVAQYAAGAAIAAAKQAIDPRKKAIPYALVRPSGHHAQPTQADGYCFFNNIAIATEAILTTDRIERVAILDWDVHHGNGTQEVFYDRDDVLFVSLHNDHGSWDTDAHPQTGDVDENGVGDGEGYTVNVPLPPGTGDHGYELAFDRLVLPVVAEFSPDVVLVSAGQDPGTVDPLGRNVVTKAGFTILGERIAALARERANGRLAFVQEGGYQLSHLAYATLGVFEGVLGIDTGIEDPFDWLDEDFGSTQRVLEEVIAYHSAYWDL